MGGRDSWLIEFNVPVNCTKSHQGEREETGVGWGAESGAGGGGGEFLHTALGRGWGGVEGVVSYKRNEETKQMDGATKQGHGVTANPSVSDVTLVSPPDS